MIIYLMIFIIVIFLLFLMSLIPIQLHLSYQRINNKDQIKIEMKILFLSFNQSITAPLVKILSLLAHKKYTVENIKEVTESQRLPEKNWGLILRRLNIWIPRGIKIMSHSLKLASRILKPIKCSKLNVYTEIGLFDAAQTSLAFGSLWGVYSFLMSQLSKWMILQPTTPNIKIVPDFNNPKIHLEYDCIIHFPLGHIIIVFIQTARFVRISYHLIRGVTT